MMLEKMLATFLTSFSQAFMAARVESAVRSADHARRQLEALPTELRETASGKEITATMRELERRLEDLQSLIVKEQQSGQRKLWLGVLLGLPIGIVGSYVAYLLGWS